MIQNFLKNLRYIYWILTFFIKKNLKIILTSLLISFFLILGLITIYPYLQFITLSKKQIIGLVHSADFNNLPEEITSKISNGLFFYANSGELIPVLIDHWEKSNDNLIYRFYLKKKLLWSDGKVFTANDINYSFEDIKKRVINDYLIEFQLKRPLPIFPIYLTKPLIRNPLVGIGGEYLPGKIKTAQGRLKTLTLIPNDRNKPVIIYKFYSSESQLITAYKKGEINKIKVSKKSVADQFINWKNTNVIKQVDYNHLLTLFFNFNNSKLKEKDIRQAIISGINFNQLSEYGEIAKGPYSPLQYVYNENLKNYYYDPLKSKKIIENTLLATNSAKFNLKTYSDFYDVAELVASNLNEINIPCDVAIINYEIPKNFDFFLAYIELPKDPDQYYFWHSTQKTNIGNYNNVRVDKLLEDGRSTLDFKKRKEIYNKLQEIFQNDPPAIFLYFPYYYVIERK